jgi:hypothetical protein
MLHNTRPAEHRGPCPPVIARETKEAFGAALRQESVATRRKVSGGGPADLRDVVRLCGWACRAPCWPADTASLRRWAKAAWARSTAPTT